jgi:tetratricopeptide (TPR) repeat protein
LAHEKDSVKQEANAYFQLGLICQKKGNSDSTLALMSKALELRKVIGNQPDIAETYSGIGQVYYNMADYQKSIDCFSNAIKIKESINDPVGLAIAYYNFGRTHTSMNSSRKLSKHLSKLVTRKESPILVMELEWSMRIYLRVHLLLKRMNRTTTKLLSTTKEPYKFGKG